MELNKTSFIQSSTGYTAKVDYSGKGWISGKRNSFTAALYHEGREKDPLYTVEGQWSESFTIKDAHTKKVVDTYTARNVQTTPLIIAPIEQQDALESRRAWHKVAEAISKGDMEATQREKSIIENQQREMRKREKEEGREWDRRFFTKTSSDPVFERLAGKIGETIDADKTNGVWIFDPAKAQNARPPFRQQ